MDLRVSSLSIASAVVLALLACDARGGSGSDGGTLDARTLDAAAQDAAAQDAGPMQTPVCTTPAAVSCIDESILDLSLFVDVNPVVIENTADSAGWMTYVDATGGGYSATLAYVYARFTDTGLERVDVGDEAAFESMDWDIAFRRYVIRLNSGVSGPSCVGGVRAPVSTEYEALTAPLDLPYETEEYFTESCELVPDGSGLNSPGTVLHSFWEYPGCVKMTGNVYQIRLASERVLKLTVTSYYDPDVQTGCDRYGTLPDGPTGSGNLLFRWAFLDP